ncbi:MAG: hypothetical protein DRZ79_02290 [Candidatus Cloacimonadota bacterium]|nr:MAG: hypothetical protein DRZ79_02290 [Candidatus Cloacimonadota bacterium]
MNKNKFLLIIAAELLVALIYYIICPYRTNLKYNLTLGQIAERDIIAPFDFLVYKSPDVLKSERETAASKVEPVYKVSENLKFNALKNLDFIFQYFSKGITEVKILSNQLSKNGYQLSENNIKFLMKSKNRQKIYNYLIEKLDSIFNVGIYSANIQSKKIRISRGEKIKKYPLSRLYSLEEARDALVSGVNSQREKECVKELANIILIENIVPDVERTKIEKQKARESVSATIGKVLKNEKIISKNQKVTTNELLKLRSLQTAEAEQKKAKSIPELLLSSFGIFLLSLILFFSFYYILLLFFPANYTSYPNLFVILSSFLASIFFTIFPNLFNVPSLIIPFAMPVILVAFVFNPHIGLFFNFFNLIFVSHFLNWNFINPAILSIATIGGIIALKQMKKKVSYTLLTFYLFIPFLLINISISLIKFDDISIFLRHLLFGSISIVLTIIGLRIVVPFVERKLNMATKQILLELLDFDNPLLKKISSLATGTYHHSLIVGNLSESAAEAIGANYLLARVGSYYHDIGKIENPKFFIENNPNSSELHEDLLANESALIIKKHVSEGIRLGKKYKLPQQVIDIIRQHHGTSAIKYFLNKAKKTNLKIDDFKEQFYYDGPKPQTKEAAIVMIADIIESTTKSKNEHSEEIIKKIFDDTIEELIKDGQLDDAPLTLKELKIIKETMFPIIMGVYRKRIDY